MNLVFLDTETTGISPLEDWLFQLSFKHQGRLYHGYFKPPVPISIKASSITHVTNKMVNDAPSFQNSALKEELNNLLKTNILVAHNAIFDTAMLSKEGVAVPRFICTLKLIRFLDEEASIPEYNLQYLRYFFDMEITADAHDARGDVLILEQLFSLLYQKWVQKYGVSDDILDKMVHVSHQPALIQLFPFGKYKGRKLKEINEVDKGYLEWILEKKQDNPEPEEDWIYSLKFFLKKN